MTIHALARDGRPLAIDLFCGLGGWTDGLLAEGWRVVGYDIEEHAYGDERYKGELVVQDVLTLHGSQFKDADLIVASPPCQEYSYMAMPWSLAKAKAAAIRADTTGAALERLNQLFNACFRIQREASEASGRHIPMVVENVRGAIPWVGRSRYNFGSFHLWGDVPALMPKPASRAGLKQQPYERRHGTGPWFAIDMASARAGITNPADIEVRKTASVSETGVKAPGMNWSDPSKRGQDFTRRAGKHATSMRPPAKISAQPPAEGRKGAGAGAGAEWFDQNISSLPSSSRSRKAASAMIAKIPEPLSRHIARTFLPAQAPA